MNAKRLAIALTGLFIAAAAYVTVSALYIFNKAESVRSNLQSLKSLAAAERQLPVHQIPNIKANLSRLEEDVEDLRSSLSIFLFAEPLWERIPILDPTPSQADLLLQSLAQLIQSAQITLGGADELLTLSQDGRHSFFLDERSAERILDALGKAAEKWQNASALAPYLEAKLKSLEDLKGGPRLKSYVKELREASQGLQELLEGGVMAPEVAQELLGMNSPKNYLILAQNSYELRATGGFIAGAWLVTIDKGQIVRLAFHDSPEVDDPSREYPPPPPPIYKYMQAGFWLFRDANWSPDFPTTAKVAAHLYQVGQRLQVDAVIGIDDHLARELVVALGPIPLEAFQLTVSSANVTSVLEQGLADIGRIDKGGIPPRKFLLKLLGDKILQKVQSGLTPEQMGRIGGVLLWGLQEKHLLLYVPGSTTQQLLEQRNWSGSLQHMGGDYLQVVDSNVGYNKINHNVEQSIKYEVSWDDRGTARGELTVAYSNTSTVKVEECQQSTSPGGYEEWKVGCYWNYMRVFIPGEAQVEGTTYVALPKGSLVSTLAKLDDPNYPFIGAGDKGTKEIGLFFVVPPAEQKALNFSYVLPREVLSRAPTGSHYSLLVQKQAGTLGHPLKVKVTAPPGMVISETSPTPAALDDKVVEFQSKLNKDTTFTVLFAPKG